jgi:hypothetical protein
VKQRRVFEQTEMDGILIEVKVEACWDLVSFSCHEYNLPAVLIPCCISFIAKSYVAIARFSIASCIFLFTGYAYIPS